MAIPTSDVTIIKVTDFCTTNVASCETRQGIEGNYGE